MTLDELDFKVAVLERSSKMLQELESHITSSISGIKFEYNNRRTHVIQVSSSYAGYGVQCIDVEGFSFHISIGESELVKNLLSPYSEILFTLRNKYNFISTQIGHFVNTKRIISTSGVNGRIIRLSVIGPLAEITILVNDSDFKYMYYSDFTKEWSFK